MSHTFFSLFQSVLHAHLFTYSTAQISLFCSSVSLSPSRKPERPTHPRWWSRHHQAQELLSLQARKKSKHKSVTLNSLFLSSTLSLILGHTVRLLTLCLFRYLTAWECASDRFLDGAQFRVSFLWKEQTIQQKWEGCVRQRKTGKRDSNSQDRLCQRIAHHLSALLARLHSSNTPDLVHTWWRPIFPRHLIVNVAGLGGCCNRHARIRTHVQAR